MMNNELYRRRMNEQQEKLAEEREFWNKKKASIQEGFMKELNEGSTPAVETTAPSKAPESAAGPPAPSVQGSDDDGVLVEADTSGITPVSGKGGGGGGKKKKKGKGKK